MFVCCECCLLSSRGLCDELTARSEESYRVSFFVVCDVETSRMGGAMDRSASQRKKSIL